MEERKKGEGCRGEQVVQSVESYISSRVHGCEGEYVSYSVCCWPFFFFFFLLKVMNYASSGGGQALRSGGIHAVSK